MDRIAESRKRRVTLFFSEDRERQPSRPGVVYRDVMGVDICDRWIVVRFMDGTTQGFRGDRLDSYYLTDDL